MAIRGAENMSGQELAAQVQNGAKIVVFQYCVSVIVLRFKRSSDPFLIRPGESAFAKSLPYTLISLTFGWWGIPWGFIYTPWALIVNLGGGKDVTREFAGQLGSATPLAAPQLQQAQWQPPQQAMVAPVTAGSPYAPGTRVRVHGADGYFYPGTLVGVQQGYARVAFDGGREDWVPLQSVTG
jgi:hypothetical protein